MLKRARWAIAALALMAAAIPAKAAPKQLKLAEVEQILANFIEDLTAEQYEKAALTMSALGKPYDDETMKKHVLALNSTGKPTYNDKILDRFYGKTGKDRIYKIATKENMLFIRFVLHKGEAENWLVVWFAAQTEVQAPLPRVWNHVQP